MKPLLSFLLTLGLAGCAVGDRGVESVHQPIVADNVAFVPNCPNWSDTTGGERETQSSNFGCATNSNLAAMIANPIDLIHGRTDPANAELEELDGRAAWD